METRGKAELTRLIRQRMQPVNNSAAAVSLMLAIKLFSS